MAKKECSVYYCRPWALPALRRAGPQEGPEAYRPWPLEHEQAASTSSSLADKYCVWTARLWELSLGVRSTDDGRTGGTKWQ